MLKDHPRCPDEALHGLAVVHDIKPSYVGKAARGIFPARVEKLNCSRTPPGGGDWRNTDVGMERSGFHCAHSHPPAVICGKDCSATRKARAAPAGSDAQLFGTVPVPNVNEVAILT